MQSFTYLQSAVFSFLRQPVALHGTSVPSHLFAAARRNQGRAHASLTYRMHRFANDIRSVARIANRGRKANRAHVHSHTCLSTTMLVRAIQASDRAEHTNCACRRTKKECQNHTVNSNDHASSGPVGISAGSTRTLECRAKCSCECRTASPSPA